MKLLLSEWTKKHPDLFLFIWLELLKLKTQWQYNDDEDDDHWLNLWVFLDCDDAYYYKDYSHFSMIEPKPVDRTYPEIIEALKEILDKNESVKESP